MVVDQPVRTDAQDNRVPLAIKGWKLTPNRRVSHGTNPEFRSRQKGGLPNAD
jgi:hypothetical protein